MSASQRMTLRIEQGKGSKDRYAMLSPVLLERQTLIVDLEQSLVTIDFYILLLRA